MRVLIADDDPVSLRLLRRALERLRHDVVEATDGQGAWELYEREDFPLVITDWLMPRMSGLELCQAIRAESREKYSYVVIVTSLSDREKTLEGFRAGADDYLAKPVDLEQLATRIEVAVRVRGGMNAKVEMTMRRAVEASQRASSEGPALLESVKALGDFYRTQRAYTKARAFLRRQISLAEAHADPTEDIDRLRRELDSLQGLEDERA